MAADKNEPDRNIKTEDTPDVPVRTEATGTPAPVSSSASARMFIWTGGVTRRPKGIVRFVEPAPGSGVEAEDEQIIVSMTQFINEMNDTAGRILASMDRSRYLLQDCVRELRDAQPVRQEAGQEAGAA